MGRYIMTDKLGHETGTTFDNYNEAEECANNLDWDVYDTEVGRFIYYS